MEKFFSPKSIAVIGVSESPANLAKNIVGNLLEFGFNGIIYQVGRIEGTLFNQKIYTSVLEIEDPIDAAVILTPAPTIPAILDECGRRGIKNVIIESAGFREYDEDGRAIEERLTKTAKKYGIRFIGPNCIGTMDVHSGLATSFVGFKDDFKRGDISVITQSGGVGFSYLNIFGSENLGLSKFASIGNKLNVDENDLLEYLLKDEKTGIICIYLEGVSDGIHLMELARHATKPILLQKANIGNLAKSIARSHAASLSSDDAVVSAALKQCGIARVTDKETLVNTLKILPLPRMRGNRLAIISRSGGHAIIAADASEECGFELAPLSKTFIKEVEGHLRGNVIKLTNPIDIGDLFDYGMYAKIIEETLRQDYVDGVVFMHAYFSATEGKPSRTLFNQIVKLSKKYDKPVGICIATDEDELSRLRKDISYPIFDVPTAVIRALAQSREFYLRRAHKIPPHPPLKKGGKENFPVLLKGGRRGFRYSSKIIKRCIKQKRNPLLQEGMAVFEAYGIPVVKSVWVKNEDEAAKAAQKIGYPVALKISSQKISHKTDVGGVRLNIRNEQQLREEYKEITKIAKDIIIQPMLKRGWELILGAKQDPNFGPIVMAGLGGIFVEIFKDTSIRVVPFDRNEAASMLAELKGYKILQGARGDKPYDIKGVEDAILRLAQLIADFPEIKEIDINPFYVLHRGQGGCALDARIIL